MPRARTRRRTMKRRFRGGATAEEAKRAQREAELKQAVDEAWKAYMRQARSPGLGGWITEHRTKDIQQTEENRQILRNAIIEQEKFRLIKDVIKDEEFSNISNKEYIVDHLIEYETIGDLISGITSPIYDLPGLFEFRIKDKSRSKKTLNNFKKEMERRMRETERRMRETELKANFPTTAPSQTDINNFVESMGNYIYTKVYTQSPFRGGDGKRSRTKRRRRVGGRRQQQRRTQRRRTKSKRSKSTRRR